MEIWLKKDDDAIQIPILPPSFSVTAEGGHQTVNVQTKGDVTILGKRGLKTVEFSSFFPAQDYPFAAYPKDRNPYNYVKKILTWLEKAIRVTITGTNINMECTIQTFTYGEPDGSGDIEYTISMREYRPPTVVEASLEIGSTVLSSLDRVSESGATLGLSTVQKLSSKELNALKKNNTPIRTTKETKKTYTVKQGDTLCGIAKQFYGSGSKSSKIYSANKSIIESAAKKHGISSSSKNGVAGWWIFPGTKLVIPS